ncbi:MAG: hypothetical protein ABI841_06280, partial [Chloroflexota bacterium]
MHERARGDNDTGAIRHGRGDGFAESLALPDRLAESERGAVRVPECRSGVRVGAADRRVGRLDRAHWVHS